MFFEHQKNNNQYLCRTSFPGDDNGDCMAVLIEESATDVNAFDDSFNSASPSTKDVNANNLYASAFLPNHRIKT